MAAEENKDDPQIVSELEEEAKKFESFLELWANKENFLKFLKQVDNVLDKVEEELSQENRIGPWLCGPEFSAADVSLTAFLFRLYQVIYVQSSPRHSCKIIWLPSELLLLEAHESKFS